MDCHNVKFNLKFILGCWFCERRISNMDVGRPHFLRIHGTKYGQLFSVCLYAFSRWNSVDYSCIVGHLWIT